MKAPCGSCAICEQCPYDDCTWDGVSPEEWEASKEVDADARHADESKKAAKQRAYREANREKVAEYNRRYYQKRKKAKNDAARNSKQVRTCAVLGMSLAEFSGFFPLEG